MNQLNWIELDGAVNVRELGGLPTTDGGRTTSGRLLRSDNLQDLTTFDIKTLVDGHGVRTVIDLRSPPEAAAEGPTPLQHVRDVRHLNLPVLPVFVDEADLGSEALAAHRARNNARYPEDFMCSLYLGYLEDRPENVVAAVREIAHADGAVLVHCAAGKDRTGTVVATTLAAVGVDPAVIVADFAATGHRIEAILERLRARETYAEGVNRLSTDAHTPRAETMHAFLQQLDVRYGGPQEWLRSNGLAAADLARLRSRLVGDGAEGAA